MTKLTITATFAAAAAEIKSPWVINNGVDLRGPFASREAARTAKVEQELGGRVEKFELANYVVETEDDGSSVHGFSTHGLLRCPSCDSHLSNGVGNHGDEVNGKAVKHASHQYACLGCGAEFGPALKKKVAAAKTTDAKTHQNSSSIERPTKAVWHIADEMKAANPEVRRKDVIAECMARGIATFTARTQYQQWFQVQKEMLAREAQAAK